MNNADSFDRLIKSCERELRDLKTISVRPFGLIRFYTKTFTTGTTTGFRVILTFDQSAILPAMLTIIIGASTGLYSDRWFRTIRTTPGTYTYEFDRTVRTARQFAIRLDSSSPFTATITEES